jgi:hypothetical protein
MCPSSLVEMKEAVVVGAVFTVVEEIIGQVKEMVVEDEKIIEVAVEEEVVAIVNLGIY